MAPQIRTVVPDMNAKVKGKCAGCGKMRKLVVHTGYIPYHQFRLPSGKMHPCPGGGKPPAQRGAA